MAVGVLEVEAVLGPGVDQDNWGSSSAGSSHSVLAHRDHAPEVHLVDLQAVLAQAVLVVRRLVLVPVGPVLAADSHSKGQEARPRAVAEVDIHREHWQDRKGMQEVRLDRDDLDTLVEGKTSLTAPAKASLHFG